ncbi:MAG: STAS domain-containing protein [Bacteroidota bacterium]
MSATSTAASRIPDIVQRHERELLADWIQLQVSALGDHPDRGREEELKEQSRQFLRHFAASLQAGADVRGPAGGEIREFLNELSRERAAQGYTPNETATFVFSLKQPLFTRLRQELARDPDQLADQLWAATLLLDQLGLYTSEFHQKSREETIRRQEAEMVELSTPVVELWEGILALPVIGTLDSGRAQVVMENLLQKIVETGSSYAIIDITGVPTVDTLVAQHLLKTISAARLMGAECIISGIRPQIAQTIVHLGVELQGVATKSTLADAFAIALARRGLTVVSRNGVAPAPDTRR